MFILAYYKNQLAILDTKTNVYYFMKGATKREKAKKCEELNSMTK